MKTCSNGEPQGRTHYPNLDYLRLGLALLVVLGHCWQNAIGKIDPLGRLLGGNSGWFGVNAFFALSGYLIFQSREGSVSSSSFLWKRFLRIYPAFLVCMIAVGIAYGVAPSVVDVLNIATLGNLKALNDSTWSIRYEEACYFTVALLFGFGLLGKKTLPWLFAVSYVFSCLRQVPTSPMHPADTLDLIARMYPYFLAGSCLYAFNLPLKGRLAAIALGGLIVGGLVGGIVYIAPLTLPYVLLWAGIAAPQIKKPWKHDLSYGTYLYHLPIIGLLPHWSFLPLAASVMALSLGTAFASWVLVESKARIYKNRLPSLPKWKKREARVEPVEAVA